MSAYGKREHGKSERRKELAQIDEWLARRK